MTIPAYIYRQLSPAEEKEFREWARKNWKPGKESSGAWHPVVVDEWTKLAWEYRQANIKQDK